MDFPMCGPILKMQTNLLGNINLFLFVTSTCFHAALLFSSILTAINVTCLGGYYSHVLDSYNCLLFLHWPPPADNLLSLILSNSTEVLVFPLIWSCSLLFLQLPNERMDLYNRTGAMQLNQISGLLYECKQRMV